MVPVSTAHVLPPWTREAPVQRLAFVLRIEEGRVAFFEQGASGHAILPLAEFESRYAGRSGSGL